MEHKTVCLNNLHERDIHPFLVSYLAKKMNVYSKTIYHEVSTKIGRGKSEWLHPDVVGFNLPVENWSEKVLDLCGKFSINRATIYSFELKKKITIETLREQFFQAVSNSSWANEGFLVGVDIDVDNIELIQELSRLSSAFGIGVIKLNLNNCEESEILFPSRRKLVLDGETMNKLFTINTDFQDFIQVVLDSIKINHTIIDRLDAVLSKSDLKEILDKAKISIDEGVKNKTINYVLDQSDNIEYLRLENDFAGKSPVEIHLCNNILQVNSWRELYIKTCNFLINISESTFISVSTKCKGKKRIYFSNNKNEISKPYFLEKVNLYAEINFNANDIVKNIRIFLKEFNIEEKDVLIRIAK